MVNLSNLKNESIKILDAGAGTGILSIALLEKLEKDEAIKNIEIDLYENDKEVISILEKNMLEVKGKIQKITKYNIIKENFILDNVNQEYQKSYDIIISNLPYKKIGKNDIESKAMNEVIYGQPNLYFLFMTMAMKLLNENGEMIFIVPGSWTSGVYFKKFRQVFLDNVRITNIHLFVSRDKVFNRENVLQEVMILRAIKTQNVQNTIYITQSHSNEDVIYGLYGIYNSTLYDKYYRILNGSTQVNATEINNIPIPNRKVIENIRKKMQKKENLTTEICDNILLEVINNV